jgi:PAS domain S-box-containing protein
MAPPVDFEKLFDLSPNAYMVLDGELRYVAANQAYREVTASRLEQLLGRNIFELFPNDPNDPGNVPAQMLRKSFERVLATGQRDHLAYIPYRVPKLVDGAVVEEDRYWSATHCPVRDGAGRVRYILQNTVEVTDLHEREARSRAGATGEALRREAGVLARARAVQDENAKIEAERERLRVLFEQAPGFMCVLEGPDHVFRLANAAYTKLVGGRDVIGRPVREALPEVVAQGFIDLLDRVYASGTPFLGEAVRLFLQRQPDGEAEEVVLDFIYQPVRGPDGASSGVFVQGHDVTARKRAEDEREAALRAAEAFSEELKEQSKQVTEALERARARVAELEAQLAAR